MVELKLRSHTIDVPYAIRLYGVTDEMFDEMVDEDTKAELIDGVMIVHSPASPRHDNVAGFLWSLMRYFAEEMGPGLVLGPNSLVRLRCGRRVAPDVFFLAPGHVPDPLPQEFDIVPDLMLEVLSPSNRRDDLDIKRPAYHDAGVPECWFVDYEREEVIIDRKRRKRYASTVHTSGRLESSVLPGFWIDAAWVWSDPLPKLGRCQRELLGPG